MTGRIQTMTSGLFVNGFDPAMPQPGLIGLRARRTKREGPQSPNGDGLVVLALPFGAGDAAGRLSRLAAIVSHPSAPMCL